MAAVVGKYAAQKFLRKEMEKHKDREPASAYDPYFTYVPHPTKPGKVKKVKKQIPDYIPDNDALILAKLRKRAYFLDCGLFNFLGIRFGWSSVIGIVPGIGDFGDLALSVLLAWRCSKVECGLGFGVVLRMIGNILLDFIVGLIPIIGDIVDGALKANTRNLRLLEERLDEVYRPQPMKDEFAKEMAKSRKDPTYPPPSPATQYEEFEDERTTLPTYNAAAEPRRPEAAQAARETRGGIPAQPKRSKGWFGGDSKRERQPDLESGGQRRDESRR